MVKNLLAPMQDGVFMEDGRERQIGRAVLSLQGGRALPSGISLVRTRIFSEKLKGPILSAV